MNICLIVVSEGWAGGETVVRELACQFRQQGHKVLLVTNREIAGYYTELRGMTVHDIGPMVSIRGMMKAMFEPRSTVFRSAANPRYLSPVLAHLAALVRENVRYPLIQGSLANVIEDSQVEVIHAHLTTAIVLASRLRRTTTIPFVATLHGASTATPALHKATGWLALPSVVWKRRRLIAALRTADRVTAVSRFELDSVEKCGASIRHKSMVIPNGINVSEIQGTPPPTSTLPGDFKLLFPGGGRLVKGGDLLIAALPKLRSSIPGIHVYVAGEVPRTHLLRRLVASMSLDDAVTFVGLLGPPEYRLLLKSVDALVMPSREEGFGIAFLEAMAMQKPVIGGNIGGVTEIVTHGRNGLLVKPEPSQIAEAIISLYERQDLRDEMTKNGLEDAARYEWASISRQYLQLYADAIRAPVRSI